MPAALPAIFTAVSTTAGAHFGALALSWGASIALGVVAGAAQFALGMLGKPKVPEIDLSGLKASSNKRVQQIREPTAAHTLIYGECRTSGPLAFAGSTSSDKYLHLVITLAAHEVQAIDTVFIDNYPIYSDMLDGNGLVNSGKYSGKIRIKKHLGAAGQTADSDLVSEVTDWTTAFKGTKRAYIYVRLEYSSDLFSNIPAISAWVRGKKVSDVRESGSPSIWTPNSVLCMRDFLLDTDHGVGGFAADVNDDTTTASANTCEEFVDVDTVDHVVLSVDTTNNFLRLKNYDTSAADTAAVLMFQTGDRVQVTAPSGFPGGLAASTNYYVIPRHRWAFDDSLYVEIQLAASYDDALTHTAIDLTSAGSGTITVTKHAEPRYTCNGPISCDRQYGDILTDLTTSFAGSIVHIGDAWHIKVGAYTSPALTFDEGDARGAIKVETRHSRRDRFNGVKGSYASPLNYGVVAQYPFVDNATYLTEDNSVRSWKTYDQAFTSRPGQAQRTAKILLERHRQQITVQYPISLVGMRVQVGDTVMITNSRFGWASKVFEVVGWSLGVTPGKPTQTAGAEQGIIVNLTLQETASAVYDWNSGEETAVDPAPNTNLPSPLSVVAPTNLVLTSGTAELYLKDDGTVVTRLHADWDASTDPFLDHYDVQYKKDADVLWIPAGSPDLDITDQYIWDAEDGSGYSVRVRAVNHLGRRSDWLTVTGHTVVGKTALPSNVVSLSAQQNGAFVTFRWPAITDADRTGYELRYMPTPFVWENAITISKETKGTLVTNAGLPPGDWIVGIKAIDTSGNYSATATTTAISVINTNDVVYTNDEAPTWRGTLHNMIVHSVSQQLIPESTKAANLHTNAELFEQFVPYPETTCWYEGETIDLGFDASTVRVYSSISSNVGRRAVGSADVGFEIDYKKAGGSYDGFESWNSGTVDARYIRPRFSVDTTATPAAVSAFSPTADVAERTAHDENITVNIGGTSITFAEQFHSIPNVIAVAAPVGSAARHALKSNITATGFDVVIVDKADNDVGGTLEFYDAIGA